MADNTDSPSFSFGIENTMEMGNQELVDSLFGTESSTADPDDVTKIVKEVEVVDPSKKTPPLEEEKNKSSQGQNLIASFLAGDGEGDDTGEETTEKQEIENQETDETGDQEEDQTQSQIAALTRDLVRLGVFTKADDEEDVVVNSPEEFLERFNLEKKNGAIEMVNNFIGQFGEDYQKAFQAIFVNGTDPKEYFGTYNKIVNFAELDLTQEDNQVAVIRQALADQGFEDEDITVEVDRLKNYGDLESVAQRHHKVLVKKEAVKLQQLEQKAIHEQQQKAVYRNQYIQNVQTILQEKLKAKEFDGIPLNPKIANELQDFLLVDKYKTVTGETLTDFDKTILDLKKPENHAMKVKVALLLKLLEKDPTLSTIQQSGITKKSDKLFSDLARQTTKEKQSPTQKKSNSWFQ